VGTLSR